MEVCCSKLFANIYPRLFRKIYIRSTRHLCSKKEDSSRPSDAISNEADSKVNKPLSEDLHQHNNGEGRTAVQSEAVKCSNVTKGASQGNEDGTFQGKLLSILSDIKVLNKTASSQNRVTTNLSKPLQRLRKKEKDPAVLKEKEMEMQLRTGYGNDMPSAVKAVASSLGGDVKQTEEKLVQTLTSIANGLPIEEPVQSSMVSNDSKNEASTSVDEVSKNMMMSVEAVASTVSGEPKVAESELTKKLLSLAAEKRETESADMSEVVEGMKVDRTVKAEDSRKPRTTLGPMHKHRRLNEVHVNLFDSAPLNAFKLENKDTSQDESSKVAIWDELQKNELQSLVQYGPSNPYEEMIRWTDQGKLWTFPINNEAGMHEEENVSFHEHVFLDHHLQEGFPKKGPIRHFMDLVITGLSKNPYMSVERKVEHINWYRNYFSTNREILEQYEIAD